MLAEPKIPLFVYGTLKRRFPNHHFFSGPSCTFLGTAKTLERFALYVGRFPYVTSKRKISRISGELYLIDQKTLSRIDCLEEHPLWYKRILTQVSLDRRDTKWSAYMYFFDFPQGRLVRSGIYMLGNCY